MAKSIEIGPLDYQSKRFLPARVEVGSSGSGPRIRNRVYSGVWGCAGVCPGLFVFAGYPDVLPECILFPGTPDPSTLGSLIHGFWADRKSIIFGVWAAQKPCIKKPSVHPGTTGYTRWTPQHTRARTGISGSSLSQHDWFAEYGKGVDTATP